MRADSSRTDSSRPGAAARGRGALTALLVALACVAVTLAWHGSALRGEFRLDDPLVLMQAITEPGPWHFFFSREGWQAFGVVSFTPWLVLDFWLDWKLAGLQVGWHYLHHLVVIAAVAGATWWLARPAIGPWFAALAALLFLSGAATAVVAQQLMSRHYAMGLLLSLAATACWLHALRRQPARPWTGAVAGATVLYVMAALNKEVFLPLPLVLLALDPTPWGIRLRRLAPVAVAAAVVVAWRSWMLGDLIGGYTERLGDFSAWMRNGAITLATLGGGGGRLGWVEALLGLAAVGSVLLCRREGWRIGAVLLALAAPFMAIPATPHFSDLRFAFVPWWALCLLLAWGAQAAWSRTAGTHGAAWRRWLARSALAVTGLALVAGLIHQRATVVAAYDQAAGAIDAQARLILSADRATRYVPVSPIQFQYPLQVVKRTLGAGEGPRALPFAEAADEFPGSGPVWVVDPACGCMKPVPAEGQSAGGVPAPLRFAVAFDRRRGDRIDIQGPRVARCFIDMPDINFASEMPCRFGIATHLAPWVRGQVRFWVRSSGGDWAATPLMDLPARGQRLFWTTTHGPEHHP